MSLVEGFESRWEPGDLELPVVLALHGTGGDENDLREFAETVAPGFGYLGVRGRVKEGPYNRFFRRFAEGVLDLDDLAQRTDELALALRGATEILEGRSVFALGYSNGANMAASLLLSGTGVLSGAVMLRPMALDAQQGVRLDGVRALILAGQVDSICPPEGGVRLQATLSGLGADARIEVLGAGHELTQGDVVLTSEFFSSVA